MLRKIAAVAAVLMLAGCVTAPPNPLTPTVREAMFVKDVQTAWTLDAKGNPQPKTDEDKAKLQENNAKLDERLKAAVTEAFATSPAGAEPVAFKINIKRANPGFLGSVDADVAVIRLADGAEVGVYKDVMGADTSGANGGLLGIAIAAAMKPDSIGIMSNNFATTLRARFDAKK